MAIKMKLPKAPASEKLQKEYERILALEAQYVQKQLEATQTLETLLARKSELDAQYVSELDRVEQEKLGKVRRDLRIAIEDAEMLAMLDVKAEIRKQMNAGPIKEYQQEARKESEDFRREVAKEKDAIDKAYEADLKAIEDLLRSHPYSKAQGHLTHLYNKTRRA
mgnify:FL=1